MRASRMMLLAVLSSPAATAAVFTVDTTSDAVLSACTPAPSDCSLRGAITSANATLALDNIEFAIPNTEPGCTASTGVCRISVPALLPDIAEDLIIDGYTQPGAQANTIAADQGGLDSAIKIEIVQQGILGGAALRACGPNSAHQLTVRGLAIAGGFQSAIDYYASCIATQNGVLRVEGSYIGTDAAGESSIPGNIIGIQAGSPFGLTTGAMIGGTQPEQRNLISGNGFGVNLLGFGHQVLGILVGTDRTGRTSRGNTSVGVNCAGGAQAYSCLIGDGTGAGRNVLSANQVNGIGVDASGPVRIRGNLIGANVDGAPLGNGVDGIRIQGSNRATALPPEVGGPGGDANLIAFNGRAGILVSSPRHHIAENQFHDNRNLAIWFGNSGRQVNDAGDADGGGANHGQNFPEIASFSASAGSITLNYSVDSTTAHSGYPLEVRFFKAHRDEGSNFLGSDSYAASSAQLSQLITLPLAQGLSVGPGEVVIATATDSEGNTSEFSFYTANLAIQPPLSSSCTSSDSVFCSDFEPTAGPSLLARVSATATSGPFKPNGQVTVTDNRGGSCVLTLAPTPIPAISAGACVLAGSGAPGPIQITATLDAAQSAFASSAGTSIVVSASFTL